MRPEYPVVVTDLLIPPDPDATGAAAPRLPVPCPTPVSLTAPDQLVRMVYSRPGGCLLATCPLVV
ncbi:MAG TPA: hypothetical protein VH092_23510 [Urbifossiella sp.]|nr:hypothetical protein [Urbifossiella sp.]